MILKQFKTLYLFTNSMYFVYLLTVSSILYGQENDTTATHLQDSVFEQDVKINMLMISLGYSNNTVKFNDLSDEKLPSMMGDISYYSKSGLWAGMNYSNYFKASAKTFETELQLGYQNTLAKKIDFNVLYGYHNFKGDSAYQGINYKHTLNLSGSILLDIFSFGIDNYYMFGSSTNIFLDGNFAINLEKESIFHEDDYFSISPTLVISYGTDNWLYDNMTQNERMTTISTLKTQGYEIDGFFNQGYDFFVPAMYNINSFSIVVSWLYSTPSARYKAFGWSNQTGFMISLIYAPIF